MAVSDWKGGVYNERGLDVAAMLEYVKTHKSIDGFPGGEALTNEQLFELDVDVLIPAALENQVTMDNAPSIKAKILVEGANGPTTPDAHQHLHERGVLRSRHPANRRGDLVLEWCRTATATSGN